MITSIFLNIITAIISFFIALLPTGGVFPIEWTNGIYKIWSGINSFSFIVPVETILYALGIALTFHLFIFGWNSLHWIYGLLRGYRH